MMVAHESQQLEAESPSPNLSDDTSVLFAMTRPAPR